jgi:hypothetical protein
MHQSIRAAHPKYGAKHVFVRHPPLQREECAVAALVVFEEAPSDQARDQRACKQGGMVAAGAPQSSAGNMHDMPTLLLTLDVL